MIRPNYNAIVISSESDIFNLDLSANVSMCNLLWLLDGTGDVLDAEIYLKRVV